MAKIKLLTIALVLVSFPHATRADFSSPTFSGTGGSFSGSTDSMNSSSFVATGISAGSTAGQMSSPSFQSVVGTGLIPVGVPTSTPSGGGGSAPSGGGVLQALLKPVTNPSAHTIPISGSGSMQAYNVHVVSVGDSTVSISLDLSAPGIVSVVYGSDSEEQKTTDVTSRYALSHVVRLEKLKSDTQYTFSIFVGDEQLHNTLISNPSYAFRTLKFGQQQNTGEKKSRRSDAKPDIGKASSTTSTTDVPDYEVLSTLPNVSDFYALSKNTNTIELEWKNPQDLSIKQEVMIVRQYGRFPLSPNDGYVIYKGLDETTHDSIFGELRPMYAAFVSDKLAGISSGSFASAQPIDDVKVSTARVDRGGVDEVEKPSIQKPIVYLTTTSMILGLLSLVVLSILVWAALVLRKKSKKKREEWLQKFF